ARTLPNAAPGVSRPAFAPGAHDIGIVHLGLGAFHRAHQAVYTDDAIAADGGDWRIAGVGMRSTTTAEALAAQDGFFTVLERGPDAAPPRIIGSLGEALSLVRDRGAVEARLAAPKTKIITLTITEKGYRRDPKTGGLLIDAPDIAQDLATPNAPATVPGLLAQALKRRYDGQASGVTLLSCDNLMDNGAALRAVVTEIFVQSYPELRSWIEDEVRFPSSMVDRITPRAGEDDRTDAERAIGLHDAAPVACEPFRQWVIEENFAAGRPRWEAGGALLVRDVEAHERLKLRMLNGAHSLLAYAGHVAGYTTISDCLATPSLRGLCSVYLDHVRASLAPVPGLDYADYAASVMQRFENPRILHATAQVAADGSEKMPVRVFSAAEDALEHGEPITAFAFATALWFRYLLGWTEAGAPYALNDPKEREIRAAVGRNGAAAEILQRLLSIDGLLPTPLFAEERWTGEVVAILDRILKDGVIETAQ
ncbi:MAG: mannitol dehydrogenase family protein, partial [Pseudomonadota bacterium]